MISNYDNEYSKSVTDSSSKSKENKIFHQLKKFHIKDSILFEGTELFWGTSNSFLDYKTPGSENSHIIWEDICLKMMDDISLKHCLQLSTLSGKYFFQFLSFFNNFIIRV